MTFVLPVPRWPKITANSAFERMSRFEMGKASSLIGYFVDTDLLRLEGAVGGADIDEQLSIHARLG